MLTVRSAAASCVPARAPPPCPSPSWRPGSSVEPGHSSTGWHDRLRRARHVRRPDFQDHGGYEVAAGADLFPDRVEAFGAKFGVRSAALHGAVRLPPPARAGWTRSPSCHRRASPGAGGGRRAGRACTSTWPSRWPWTSQGAARLPGRPRRPRRRHGSSWWISRLAPTRWYIEAVKRIHQGAIGDIVFGEAAYHADCPFEQWYRGAEGAAQPGELNPGWGLDRALSGDIITEQEVYAGRDELDHGQAAGLRHRQLRAKARPRIGTCADHFVVLYQYSEGVGMQFSGRQFKGHGTAEGSATACSAHEGCWRPSTAARC